jgi:hypothetical protein
VLAAADPRGDPVRRVRVVHRVAHRDRGRFGRDPRSVRSRPRSRSTCRARGDSRSRSPVRSRRSVRSRWSAWSAAACSRHLRAPRIAFV